MSLPVPPHRGKCASKAAHILDSGKWPSRSCGTRLLCPLVGKLAALPCSGPEVMVGRNHEPCMNVTNCIECVSRYLETSEPSCEPSSRRLVQLNKQYCLPLNRW